MGDSVQGTKGEESVLGAWQDNSMRALATADPMAITLSGGKVDSFMRNLMGDVHRVTNDAWMSNMMDFNQSVLQGGATAEQAARGSTGMPPRYPVVSSRIREAGDKTLIMPSEMQETSWTSAMALMEGARKAGISVQDMLPLLSRKDILATPDFATLFKDPTYRNVLEESGYGAQVDKLQPFQFPKSETLTRAEQAAAETTAGRLQGLAEMRQQDARRKAFFMPQSMPRTAMASQTVEAVPGAASRHLEGMIDAPLPVRERYTTAVRKLSSDPRGRDLMTKQLGMAPSETRSMSGAYLNSRGELEFNPGTSIPSEVQLTARGRMPAADERKLNAISAARGGFTAQEGTPYNVLRPDEKGTMAFVPRDRRAPAEVMEPAVRAIKDPDNMFLADTGMGTAILNMGDQPIPKDTVTELGGILQGDIMDRARVKAAATGKPVKRPPEPARAAGVGGDMIEYTTRQVTRDGKKETVRGELNRGQGSGAVVREMFRHLDELTPAEFRRLDSSEVRTMAGDLAALNVDTAKKQGFPLRDDVQNMLRIVKERGLAGLRAAVGAREFLPSLAAIGLASSVYRQAQRSDS
jgi:hypothetical protein